MELETHAGPFFIKRKIKENPKKWYEFLQIGVERKKNMDNIIINIPSEGL